MNFPLCFPAPAPPPDGNVTLKQTQAIITPLAPRKSHRTLLVGISLIWTGGTVVALPAGIFSTLYQRER